MLSKYMIQTRISTLSMRTAQAMALGRLPAIRKDPFDRILVAHCIAEKTAAGEQGCPT
jgi:PIN domain nuclease of toxin-antitoxin system